MAAVMHLENFYSFRSSDSVFGGLLQPQTPTEVSLAQIEAQLVRAGASFHARRYQDAIGAYKQAEALLYAVINPGYAGGVYRRVPLPRDRTLFTPLLSASLEYMNVLPPHEPLAAVRGRVPVDPAALGGAAQLNQAGLISRSLESPASAGAAADLKFAETLRAQGNEKSAVFFQQRAVAEDGGLVQRLQVQPAGAAAPVEAAPAHVVPAQGAVEGVDPGVFNLRIRQAGGGFAAGHHQPFSIQQDGDVFQSQSLGSLGLLAIQEAISAPSPFTAALAQAAQPALPPDVTVERSLGTMIGGAVATFTWNAGDAPPIDAIQRSVYEERINLLDLSGLLLQPVLPADLALGLPHAYYYQVPLGLAECYHALGDYATAESFYLQAESYQYLNTAIEAPYLWLRLASLYLDWGNALFRDEQAPAALPIYERVIMTDRSVPGSALYTDAALTPGADAARTVISNFDRFLSDPAAASSDLAINPQVAASVVEVYQQVVKIAAGLDFWGHWHPAVPIWTFDYLQQVAVSFTQLAISAERDVINFWDHADQGTLTRNELSQRVGQAKAEADAAQTQIDAALVEQSAFQAGVDLAGLRSTDAQQGADEYSSTSASAIVHQALQAQMSGGDDGDSEDLNEYADSMMSGSYSLDGSRGTLSAAEGLTAARLSRQYEVDSMQRTAAEMDLAKTQADAELAAAAARVTVARAAKSVADLRAHDAGESLAAFDAQTFTPDVWHAMGTAMNRLYRRYLAMAIRVAKLMQQAYNFETDQAIATIKSDYTADEVRGLLGADALMADVQGFTYDLVTASRGKPQPIKQTISLAERYGWAFETAFRKSGAMTFETRIDDFDSLYPGTYAGRVRSVDVEVVGIVPVTGVSGTLTNNGISSFRTPASFWADPATSGLKHRVQSSETLVLSDWNARGDALLAPPDTRRGGIFEGAGVASTWALSLPRELNDIDYGALVDVRLTFMYEARFDPDLAARVKAQLASRPGINERQRAIPLRWLYPDLFFRFRDSGQVTLTLAPRDLPVNQTRPVLTSVGLQVSTSGGLSPAGITLSLSTPGTPAGAKGATDASGSLSSTTAGGPFVPLAQGAALGLYQLSVTAADNPALVKNGALALGQIANVALVLGYTFTPRG